MSRTIDDDRRQRWDLPRAGRVVLALGALYAAAGVLGFALLVLAFQTGLLASIDIMFYRGLVLVAAAFLATFGLLAALASRWRPVGLRARDAFAASVLSLSFNLSFLVVVPVTVDRSISIFILGRMAARPDAAFTSERMSALFSRVYVGEDRQIDRRLREQLASGNIEQVGDAYRIASRGRLVIETAKIVAALFGSRAGMVAPREADVASAQCRETGAPGPGPRCSP